MDVYPGFREKGNESQAPGFSNRSIIKVKFLRFQRLCFVLIALAVLFPAPASASGSENSPKGLVADTFAPFETLLERHLIEKTLENDGLVSAFDYRAALEDPDTKEILDEQRRRLAGFDISSLDSREKAIAFWNNAYNFFMIYQILTELDDGKIVESVWDYGGRYSPFKSNVFERDRFTIGGSDYSLDDMEKGILLGDEFKSKGWKDARVHFTVNCAAVGCPPLRAKIYTSGNIDAMMAENTRRAFNTPRHLRLEGTTLYVTSLFDWYEEDFTEEHGSIKDFIRAYADDAVIDKVNEATRINYIDYDWSLNRPENFPELQTDDSVR